MEILGYRIVEARSSIILAGGQSFAEYEEARKWALCEKAQAEHDDLDRAIGMLAVIGEPCKDTPYGSVKGEGVDWEVNLPLIYNQSAEGNPPIVKTSTYAVEVWHLGEMLREIRLRPSRG